jgi:hypothetical protein
VGKALLDSAEADQLGTLDHESRQGSFNYFYEMGERFHPEPVPFSGIMEYIANEGEMVVINENMVEESEAYGLHTPAGDAPKSGVWMPLKSGSRAQGIVSLQNLDMENAFSDSDVRLLSTIANSMSVALENARLFEETQRLLKETEQRAAELAVINSIQRGMDEKLDFQAIIELVGDKLGDVVAAGDVAIRIYDPTTNIISFPYLVERGVRISLPSVPFHAEAIHLSRVLFAKFGKKFLEQFTLRARRQALVREPDTGNGSVLDFTS